jgi:hypothetical protein
MSQRSSLYFIDVCLPNDNEPSQSVQMGILRWSAKRDDRPEVYVHTYLKPQLLDRVRWANVASMGIDKQMIVSNKKLPTIDDMIKADYLKARRVICFNNELEPWRRLTANAQDVISIVSMWNELFKNNDEAYRCNSSLNAMLEYLHLPLRDDDNKHFPPLLLRLHAMVALWYVLDNIRKRRFAKHMDLAAQCSFIWPLPKIQDKWFDNNPRSLSDLSEKQIQEFFSDDLALRLNWNNLSIYACDWVFKRSNFVNHQQGYNISSDINIKVKDLVGVKELADFIFNRLLNFRIQLWLLIFYDVYEHKSLYSRDIALKRGRFSELQPAVQEHFSQFIIKHLDDFLNEDQKLHLVSSLISQSLEERDKAPFTHYDFDECSKEGPDKPVYFCYSQGPDHTSYKCFYEIRDAAQNIRYRRYAIYGQGEDRALCVDFVNRSLNTFYAEVRNPFSSFWVTPELRLWIHFITGISWADYTRPTKMGDDPHVLECRRKFSKLMERANLPYVKKLKENLVEAIESINSNNDYVMPPKCFNFQGTSIEIETCKRKEMGFFKRLFSFR